MGLFSPEVEEAAAMIDEEVSWGADVSDLVAAVFAEVGEEVCSRE